MAIIALHSAATGLSAQSTALDVIANNLANANTDGFKASRTIFQDLLYIEKAQAGAANANGDQRPVGLYIGLGVKVAGTQLDFRTGSANRTGRELDLMIEGLGFFQVEIDDDIGDGFGYTRAGNFALNSEGELVLITDQGRRLVPSIQIPEGASNISISDDGIVTVDVPGQVEPAEVGQIEIASFINPTGMKQIGENLFIPTIASGEPSIGAPLDGGRGRLRQGFVEGSNVDPVTELVNLIRTQRAFELNSQSLQAADEVLQSLGNLRRF
ncbi:MAG: flagellar basal-body rod protein FlgG [Planctomycetes bacterium]|nr:flagellar basal-body rod protein FlgG [Planctomycetota bacterium]